MNGEPIVYATVLVWNEKEFKYDEYSGRTRGTIEEAWALDKRPLIIVLSVRSL